MSRIENTGKNFTFTVISTLLTSLLSMVTRTVFIKELGVDYLGANGLFTNILSMLSLSELGIGSAISFSLYKPLANSDTETIKSIMSFYKKAYRIIGFVIAGIGLLLIPFLTYLIKDPGNMEHVTLIYLVFLYNTVISYLFTYKVTLLSADQKSYLMTNVNMVISVITAIIQLFVMIIFKNYFIYLFSSAVIGTAQWGFVNKFIYNRYPYLKEEDIQPLDKTIFKSIKINVKAMMFHKVGELCINQTDNIIISSFISIAVVGIYNNYYMIINIINKFALSFFNSATASLGNLIATESCERRYEVFKRYNFLGFWVFGWTGICLYVLLTPFVQLWLGQEFTIDHVTLSFVMINYYLVGMRTTVGNVKMAAGLYSQDQWVPVVQSIINLTVSIAGARYMGLAGVFLGTVVSSLSIPCWYRPMIVYKYAFKRPSIDYFKSYFAYAAVVAVNLAAVMMINKYVIDIFIGNVYTNFILKMGVCLIIPNFIIILVYRRTDEFRYLMQLTTQLMERILNGKKRSC